MKEAPKIFTNRYLQTLLIIGFINFQLKSTYCKQSLDPLGLSQLNNAANFEKNKLSAAFNIESYVSSWQNLVKLFANDDQTKRERLRKHMSSGVLRSGEGTAEQIMQKRKHIEERKMLQDMLQSGEYSDDPLIQKKLYDLYLEHHNQNSVKNDDVDLTPYRTSTKVQYQQPLSLQSVTTNEQQQYTQQQLKAQPRSMQSYINIYVLVEPYPTQCLNGGQLLNQTQLYYQCIDKTDTTNVFRVDQPSFNLIVANYSDQYDCSAQNSVRQVCMCPQGYYDFQCGTQLFKQCFINITDPPMYKSFQKEDSPYYLYSVPGYDPCYYLDFNQTQSIKYLFTCKYTNDVNGIDPTRENLGYAYRDVVSRDNYSEFLYTAVNSKTGMKAMQQQSGQNIARFTIYDWKWLSTPAIFQNSTADPEVAVGIKEGVIEVDFPLLMRNDSLSLTQFIAGGRTYYESDALGQYTLSYTSKGFFDQANYVEPAAVKDNTWKIVIGVLIPGLVIGIVLAVVYYMQLKKKNAKMLREHMD